MILKLVLSPADRVAILLFTGFVILACLSYIAGASRTTRLFSLGAFLTVGCVTLLAFYVRT